MTLTNLTYEQQQMLMDAEKVQTERDRFKAALEEVDDLDSTYGEATSSGEIARKALGRPPWPEDEAFADSTQTDANAAKEGPADA